MSDPKSAPVSSPAGATPPFGSNLSIDLQRLGAQLGEARIALAMGASVLALAEIKDVQAKVLFLSRRDEFGPIAPWDEAQDDAVKAKIAFSRRLSAAHAREHTPTNQLTPMKPMGRGYEAAAQLRAKLEADQRAERHRFDPRRFVTADAVWSTVQWSFMAAIGGVAVLAGLNAVGVL